MDGVYVVAAVTLLVVMVEHWIPIRPAHPIWRYVLGVLALDVPLSVWLWTRGQWDVVLVLWMVVAAGGFGTVGAWMLDAWISTRRRLMAAEREREVLHGAIYPEPIDED